MRCLSSLRQLLLSSEISEIQQSFISENENYWNYERIFTELGTYNSEILVVFFL